MTSPLHEHVSRELHRELANWIDSLKKRDTNSTQLKDILNKPFYKTGAARICFKGKFHGKCPDESFRYPDCTYPGLVIEVSWSQRTKELPKRAREFITSSKGGVRTVISIDINDSYESRRRETTGQAKFSVWRANWDPGNRLTVEKSVDNEVRCPLLGSASMSVSFILRCEQVFQNGQGQLNPSAGLHLTLGDFLCRNVANRLGSDNPRLVVGAEELHKWVQEGLNALNIPPTGSSAGQSDAEEQEELVFPASPPDSRAEGEEISQTRASHTRQPVNPQSENISPQGQAPLETRVEIPPRRSRRLAALFGR